MNTPIEWLKSYLPDITFTEKEFADRLTLFGTKVESFEKLDKNLDKIVVGKILSIEKHPDADRLIVTQVDVGKEKLQIVTGADNVSVGDLVPIVLDGGKVAASRHEAKNNDGFTIKKGKLRGVESGGMMCSIDELGMSSFLYPEAPENGIYIFDEELEVGSDAVEALSLHNTIFEYEITSNRVDCFSMIGVAREAAVAFKQKFITPTIKETGNSDDVNKYISLEIEDKELCKRFCARVVKNVKVKPSPKWLQRRLSSCGIRPINNIVDITNYVMKEYGQPMHAYDISTIEDNKIIVKRAGNEEFITLDGQKRQLDTDMVMIHDGKKAIGIGGIMGGQNSMITENVDTVVFEAACFDGTNIRLSSKRLGLRTEASSLFEKGLNPKTAYLAVQRACELIEELECGEVVGGIADVNLHEEKERKLKFDDEKINASLGTEISKAKMARYFDRLGFIIHGDNLTIPWFRTDIEGVADLAEEIARCYGYDRIPTKLPVFAGGTGGVTKEEKIERIISQVAINYGFSQSMSYSFESSKVFDRLLFSSDAKERYAIQLLNPLGEDFKFMRTTTVNGLLNCLSINYNRRNKAVRLFEIGKVYIPKELPLKELPIEDPKITLGFYDSGDFFDMKAVVETILLSVGIDGDISFTNDEYISFLHTGRQSKVFYKDTELGYLGELHPLVAQSYKLSDGGTTRTYIACLDLKTLEKLSQFNKIYKSIPKYPASIRDLSFVFNKSIKANDIERVIKDNSENILENLELFDIYEGDAIGENNRSLAYSLIFRASDRTLSDDEITSAINRVLDELKKIGVNLRV